MTEIINNEDKRILPTPSLPCEIELKFNIARDSGLNLGPESILLDFGCGSGKWVQELRSRGFQAFGCGTRYEVEPGIHTEKMITDGIIRILDLKNYVLPFRDNTFDFIFSDNVFEHVQNYKETNAEIARVLKPDGLCLHIFPSRWRPIESHVYVPFASVMKSFFWQFLWVSLGVHNEWKDCRSLKQRARRFSNYLHDETNYLSRKNLIFEFTRYFKRLEYIENLFLKYSRRGKILHRITSLIPFLPWMYSTFRSRVILLGSPVG
jgi:SAM-dependent methyltransferase